SQQTQEQRTGQQHPHQQGRPTAERLGLVRVQVIVIGLETLGTIVPNFGVENNVT
ncbi:hypothetical protein SARC_15459, partial [Sphaeroforma arctica JP610]